VLNCDYAVDSLRNPDLAAALAAAVNDWLLAEWLSPEPRLRASLVVPSRFPDLAIAEIERMSHHDGFVQVLLPARSEVPYGNRRYHPVLAAAQRHGLAVSIQYGGFSGNPSTAVGWPSSMLEEHVAMAQVMQAQLVSLIAEGTFEAIDDLRVVLVEGGFGWLPSLMWRIDKDWKGLRREVPWVRRPPSDYVREHVRLTTQPVDSPPEPDALVALMEQLGSDELLLFASDFPHWHADEPEAVLAPGLPPETRRKVMSANARAFYGW
jgi:predicted TIM-barrel fold metal-dependent hydrolase